jgi:hypothetical protein
MINYIALVAAAAAGGQFNLTCSGTLRTMVPSLLKDETKPYSSTYRIDLRTNKWCEGECKIQRDFVGKATADARVEQSLYRRALGYSHDAVKIFMPAGAVAPVIAPYVEHYAPDTTAAIFWLKNRRPDECRDKTDVAVSVDESLAAMIAAGRARVGGAN